MAQFRWTRQLEDAAQLVADDRLSDEEIATKLGYSRTQLARWKANPVFRARVEEHLKTWKESVRKRGIAIKERRIETYCNDYAAIQTIKRERAEAYANAPGGKTGLIVVEKKTVAGVEVDHYAFDRALMAESREIRKQLAIELGEWSENVQVTGADGGALDVSLAGADGNPIRALGPEILMQVMQVLRGQGQVEQKDQPRPALQKPQDGPVIDV